MKRDNTMTQRFFADAGVALGMRILEIGCGGGEVTQVLATLVGSSGSVIAVDRDPNALAIGRERMKQHGSDNVQFVLADAAEDLTNLEAFQRESFDALAGRRVLMYLPDASKSLSRLTSWLRPGGLVVFEETDSTMVPGRTSAMAAHDEVTEWFRKMLIAEGANPTMGFDLPTTLVNAGLRFERIRAEAIIQGQGTQFPLSTLLNLMKPRIVSAGIATQSKIDSMAQSLEAESSSSTQVYVSAMSFCAWARKP